MIQPCYQYCVWNCWSCLFLVKVNFLNWKHCNEHWFQSSCQSSEWITISLSPLISPILWKTKTMLFTHAYEPNYLASVRMVAFMAHAASVAVNCVLIIMVVELPKRRRVTCIISSNLSNVTKSFSVLSWPRRTLRFYGCQSNILNLLTVLTYNGSQTKWDLNSKYQNIFLTLLFGMCVSK